MQRIAIFGNAGGGKSTLAKHLATLTGLPLYPLDKIQFRPGGGAVPHEEYLRTHDDIIGRDQWIAEGYGCTASSWQRFARADTLIYVDLPLMRHRWWVVKRLVKGLIWTPEGWPKGSPMWESTLSSLKVIGLCERHLAPRYRQLMVNEAGTKRVHHLRSASDIRAFLTAAGNEAAAPVKNTD